MTHMNHSRLLCPGWTPKIASKMASLVHVSQTQVSSKAACGCHLLHPVERGPMSTCSIYILHLDHLPWSTT